MAQLSGKKIIAPLRRGWISVRKMQESHRRYIRNELSQAQDLFPILMKHRNGQRWSTEERAALLRDLRALSNLSPYLIPLLLPGGVFMLPLVAWWMDHRRKKREHDADR